MIEVDRVITIMFAVSNSEIEGALDIQDASMRCPYALAW